jgi:hypothetical protein
MNRGKHKTLVTVILLIASLITAIVIELLDGAAGGASPSIALAPHASSATGTSTRTSTGVRVEQAAPGNQAAAGSGVYHTLGTDVRLRAAATTGSAVVAIIGSLGTRVTLTCYVQGQSVSGDPYWYQAIYGGAHGYVSGFWMATGPDPSFTRLRACP